MRTTYDRRQAGGQPPAMPRQPRTGAALSLLGAAILLVVLGGVLEHGLRTPAPWLSSWLSLAVFVLSLAVVFCLRSVAQIPPAMAYLTYMGITMLGAVVAFEIDPAAMTDFPPWVVDWYDSIWRPRAVWLAGLGFCAFACGCYLATAFLPARRPEVRRQRWLRGMPLVFWVGMGLVGFMFSFLLFGLATGRLGLGRSYGDFMEFSGSNEFYGVFLFFFASGSACIAAAADTRKHFLLGVGACGTVAAILLATGNRGEIFYPGLAALAILTVRGLRLPAVLSACAFAGALFVITFVGQIRSVGLKEFFASDGELIRMRVAKPFVEMGFQMRPFVLTLEWIRGGEPLAMGGSYMLPIKRLPRRIIALPGTELEGNRFTVPDSLVFLDGVPRYLQGHGCKVEVWSTPGFGLELFAQREGCTSHGIPMARSISPMADMRACGRLFRLFRRGRPDIVHAHTPKAGVLGMVAAKAARVPFRVYQIHGFPFLTAKGWRRRLLIATERLSVFCATHVIAVGEGMRRVAIEEGICQPEKIDVLHHGSANGIDALSRFAPDKIDDAAVACMRAELALPADAKVLGFVGRLARDKGVRELVSAWRQLARADPALHLIMVGGVDARDGIDQASLSEWMHTPRIHMVGHTDNVAPWYRLFDVLALPTYREGFGNVLLEAAAMRVPVVASRIPGCSDAVVDGVTGTLVPVRDVGSLASAIARYLGNSDMRFAHGVSGRERVLRDFAPADVFGCLIRKYQLFGVSR